MGEVRTIPAREEMDVRSTWALEDLYETDEAWEAQMKEVESGVAQLAAYAGKLGVSGRSYMLFYACRMIRNVFWNGSMSMRMRSCIRI